MNKSKALGTISIAILLMPVIVFRMTRGVSASAGYRIILPFSTSWEDVPGKAVGRTNEIDRQTSDFYGYNGPGNLLKPELGPVDNQVDSTNVALGFDFGSRQLKAAGFFGGSHSYCYFALFDQTSDSDFGPPVKLQEHTFINIWYYHAQLSCCMIDAQLCNQRTGQWSTLRDFTYDGKCVEDQDHVRIHPAARRNDELGSWQFACFDMSVVYRSDPGNWYITKIWIGFDNDPLFGVPQTGQAVTYFDMLFISYGLKGGYEETEKDFWGNIILKSRIYGSVIAWDWHQSTEGYYDLILKVTDYAWVDRAFYCPVGLMTNVGANEGWPVDPQAFPVPVGINLTIPDPLFGKFTKVGADTVMMVASWLAQRYGWIVDVAWLLASIVGVALEDTGPQYTYRWPEGWHGLLGDTNSSAFGTVYIKVTLPSGSHSIPVDLFTTIYKYDISEWHPPMWLVHSSLSTRLDLQWTTPDINTNPDTGSPSASITYPSNGLQVHPDTMLTVTANVFPPSCYYLENRTLNGQTGYVFTRITDEQGNVVADHDWHPMQCSQPLIGTEDGGGTFTYDYTLSGLWLSVCYYEVHICVLATNGQGKTKCVTIRAINYRPNGPTSLSGPTTVYRGVSYTYSAQGATDPDGDSIRYKIHVSGQGKSYNDDTEYVNSGASASFLLKWELADAPGTYLLEVFAEDCYQYISIGRTHLSIIVANQAPSTPAAPSGAASGYVYVPYSYGTSATDPEADDIMYTYVWWPEGPSENTTSYYASGSSASMTHSWTRPGRHNVYVRAVDKYGGWSGFYSEPLELDIYQNDANTYDDAGNTQLPPPRLPQLHTWERVTSVLSTAPIQPTMTITTASTLKPASTYACTSTPLPRQTST